MIPSIASIIEKRHAKRRQLRMIGLIMLIVSAVYLGTVVLYYAIESSEEFFDIFTDPIIAFGLALIPPAMAIVIFDRWLVVRLVPLPRPRCPWCEQPLIAPREGRCGTCGLRLPCELIDEGQKAAPDAAHSSPAAAQDR